MIRSEKLDPRLVFVDLQGRDSAATSTRPRHASRAAQLPPATARLVCQYEYLERAAERLRCRAPHACDHRAAALPEFPQCARRHADPRHAAFRSGGRRLLLYLLDYDLSIAAWSAHRARRCRRETGVVMVMYSSTRGRCGAMARRRRAASRRASSCAKRSSRCVAATATEADDGDHGDRRSPADHVGTGTARSDARIAAPMVVGWSRRPC